MEVTIDTAIRGVWMSDQNQDEVITCLVRLMEDLVNYFNVPKSMNGHQMAQTAMMILEKYPENSLEFVALAFKKAKLGELADFHGRIDGEVIFGWLHATAEINIAYLEAYHRRKKDQLDSNLAEAAAVTSKDHKVGDRVLKKIKERLDVIDEENSYETGPHPIHSAENQIEHIRLHMKSFNRETLERFRQQLGDNNQSGMYTDVLAEIQETLDK